MRKKLQQFRRQIRSQDLAHYKETLRHTLVEALSHDQQVQQLNSHLQSSLQAHDGDAYFERIVATDRHLLKAISSPVVLSSYVFFGGCLDKFKSSLMLRSLVQVHASLLFSEAPPESTHQQIFEKLHRLAGQLICKVGEGENTLHHQRLDNYLALLTCFYAPKYHKHLKKLIEQQGIAFAHRYLMAWAKQLSKNLPYLALLANAMSHPQLSHFWSRNINEDMIFEVSCNLAAEDERVACWSLTALNSALSNWKAFSQECLQQLISAYLQLVARIYPQLQPETRPKNTHFKKQHLSDCLCVLEKLFRAVWEAGFRRVGVGQVMEALQTYSLFSLINQIEYFPDRCVLYGLLEVAICVVMELEGDDQAMCRLGRELQGTLLLGLGNKFSNHITLNALHSIDRLVRYDSCGYDRRGVVEGFRRIEIEMILEYLQFNKHHEVGALALALLQEVFSGPLP